MEIDKRTKIIHAAMDQYVRQGFDHTSISQIAEAAGVAKGTIYLYFVNKEHLVDQVFWHCHKMDVAACQEGLDSYTTAVDKLCRRAENAIRWALQYPTESKIERMYFSQPVFGYRARYTRQQLHFEAVDEIILAGISAGELKELPSPLLGDMFYGIAGSMLYYLESNPDLIDDNDFWLKCRDSIANCLRP